ncbi:hypothetical protein SBDP1_1250009 [Syntrophobacter sp. SbD1]|nr:hypothetical protein SBDP1_1250009 [Syntrophobacter sp. SbD1]
MIFAARCGDATVSTSKNANGVSRSQPSDDGLDSAEYRADLMPQHKWSSAWVNFKKYLPFHLLLTHKNRP